MLTWETLRLLKISSVHIMIICNNDSNLQKGLGVYLNIFNIHPSIVKLKIVNWINMIIPFLSNKTHDFIAQLVPIIDLLQLVVQTLH